MQVGIISTDEALRRAREAGLDLVEVAPHERPPVCRIMDYGKWKYQQKKKVKKHHEQQLKEVRMSPKTDARDKEIKVARACKFFEQGDKVQFTMLFRGRERFHQDRGIVIFQAIIDQLGEAVKVERPPRTEGRRMTMVLSPGKIAPKRPEGKPAEAKPASALGAPASVPADAAATGTLAPEVAPVPEVAPAPEADGQEA